MSAPLTPGTALTDALEGGAYRLLPSDDNVNSLHFRQIQAELVNAGMNVTAPSPEGTSGAFNARVAALPAPVPTTEPVPQEPRLAASQKMTLSNG